MPQPQTQNDAPLSERIAAAIVQRINKGELKPGDRIYEQALADEFESSRGPVRDALKTLSAKHWIEHIPNQGARVAAATATPSLETTLIAAAMLGLACRFAVTKASDAEVDEFLNRVKLVAQLGNDPSSKSERFTAATRDAGYYVISLADNRTVDDIVGPVPRSALSSYGTLGTATREARADATRRWLELATAFKMRDSLRAEAAGRAIIEGALERIIAAELTKKKK
ncbi:GntR family transcriptional regulator [Peristeroidobacter soli]|uniref:GntR family transcriptional regulator n=1 Tax=Peristeroidobacter soli TaxID=2497877 RepID=UPI00101BE829|nr:GntR family transcriptional regulator [Peristeroidobacter soli]